MSLTSTTDQFAALRETATRPVTLIRWEHSGTLELFSASGPVTFGEELYLAGELDVLSIEESRQATLSMPATAERVAELLNGTWRGEKICQIYEIPGRPDDDDYYDTEEGILKLNGVIDDSRYENGRIVVSVLHRFLSGRLTPRNTFNELSSIIPPAGQIIEHSGDKYVLRSRASTTQQPINPTSSIRGRLTTSQVNTFAPDARQYDIEATADNAPIPIVYGRRSIPGQISAYGVDGSGNLIIRVAWCVGEIFQIEKIFLNGEELPSDAEVRNYRGTTCQGVDDLVDTITTVTSYDEDLILLKAQGRMAVAYSVIKLDSAITEAPRFQAIVQGHLVYDPRYATASGDPFDTGSTAMVSYNLQFIGTNGSTPTAGMDISSNGNTVSWQGNAQISGNEAELDGTGDYVVLQTSAVNNFGTGPWSLEICCEPDVITGTKMIFSKGDNASDRGIIISTSGADLLVRLSSNGTTWDIASSVTFASSALAVDTPIKITVEFTGREYHFYVDGVHTHRIESASTLASATLPVWVGQYSGSTSTNAFDGSVSGVRMTKGANRYGGVHVATATPYADTGATSPGYVYSNIACLAFGELAMNPFYGLGCDDVSDLYRSTLWNESLIGGAVTRSTVDIVINDVRSTTDYLDILAMYADSYWFPEGDGLTLVDDRIVDKYNPNGWEVGENGKFIDNVTAWTLGTGWAHNGTLAVMIKFAGTASSVSQDFVLALEAGVTYTATMKVDVYTAGTVRLDIDGVAVIEAVSAVGHYAVEFVATGLESNIAAVADSTFDGWIGEVSCRRKKWRDENVIAGSLSLVPLKSSDTPTKVIATYITPDDDDPNWLESAPVPVALPGVTEGDVPLAETRLRLDGLSDYTQVYNKARSRLMRAQNKYVIGWTTTDIGLLYQKGMVIELYDPEYDITVDVVLENARRVSPGRYACTGSRYSDEHYPDDVSLPGGAGIVPVGAIALLAGSDVPAGWQLYSTADGNVIKGAGESVAVAATGGADTMTALSGSTDDAGVHGDTEQTFWVRSYIYYSGSGSGRIFTSTNLPDTAHSHTYNTGTITPSIFRRENVLVKKITSVGTSIPQEIIVFGLGGLTYPNMVRWLTSAKRLLKAAAANAHAGSELQTLMLTTGSTSDAHDHWSYSNISNGFPTATAFTPPYYEPVSAGGAHTHPTTLAVHRNLKRRRLAAYTGSDDYDVGVGVFFFWDGTLADIHEDYILCDGRLGTPDCEDYFIEIATSGDEETATGDNTVDVVGSTNYEGPHEHRGAETTAYTHSVAAVSHAAGVSHRHDISRTGNAFQPPYYALAVIMYNPSPVASYYDNGLLISGGEANGSTTIVDDSRHNHTATVTGGGSLAYSNAQTLFGLNTLLNSGKLIAYTTIEYGKKFTIEGFFRNSSTGSMALFANRIVGDNDTFLIRKDASGDIVLYTGNTIRTTLALGLTTDEWFYVGLCYDYSEWRLYAGKQSVGTAARATVFSDPGRDVTADLNVLDAVSDNHFQGYAAQIRLTTGAATLTGTVVGIPTVAFPTV